MNPLLVLFVSFHLLTGAVYQQPVGQPNYVSGDGFTQSYQVANAGTIGLLAHDNQAGKFIYDLRIGDIITLTFEDCQKEFEVSEIIKLQALDPGNQYSDYITPTGETLRPDQLFDRYYGGDYHLTLQTCISKGGALWGLYIIVAKERI